jgi:hypothetical protein
MPPNNAVTDSDPAPSSLADMYSDPAITPLGLTLTTSLDLLSPAVEHQQPMVIRRRILY